MALVQIVQGARILSNDINQLITGLDGTSAVNFTIKGNITQIGGARQLMQQTASSTFTDTLNLVGGLTYQYLGVAHSSATAAATTNVPMVQMQAHIRPNAATNSTGGTWVYKTTRYGSSATTDGNMAAHYSLLSQVESQSSYDGFAGGHDEVAIAGLAIIHGNGDARGGLANSNGRGYPGYLEGINFAPTSGQIIGLEVKVVNNSGTDSQYFTDPGFTHHNIGLQLVGQAEEAPYSIAVGTGGPAAAACGGHFNMAAVKIVTSDSGATRGAWRAGIYFEQNSIKDYLIDAYQCSFGTQGPPPFARLAAGMPVVALPPDGTSGDVKLFMMETVSGKHNIFFGRNLTTNMNIQFVNQAAPTAQILGITPTGNFDFAANTSIIRATQGSGVTPAFAAVTNSVSGFPTATNPSYYIRAFLGSGTTYVCWPAWQTT